MTRPGRSTVALARRQRLRLLIVWSTVAPSPQSHKKPRALQRDEPRLVSGRGLGDLRHDHQDRDRRQNRDRPRCHRLGAAVGRRLRRAASAPVRRLEAVRARVRRVRQCRRHALQRPLSRSSAGQLLDRLERAELRAGARPAVDPRHRTELSGGTYRGLVDAAWSALHATGHGHDTIVIGELAPRGLNVIGDFSGMKPLRFLRALYCVDSGYHQLRGAAAAARGCPTTRPDRRSSARSIPGCSERAASRIIRIPESSANPPNVATGDQQNGRGAPDPDYADLPKIGTLERVLDRLNSVYGSRTKSRSGAPNTATRRGRRARTRAPRPRRTAPTT